MRDAIAGGIIGFVLCVALVVVQELRSARPRRHVLRGNYFDARTPFSIVGPDVRPDRTDASIERAALRLGKISKRSYADTDA